MQSVRMHVDGQGVMWALTKCRVCGEVHKYLAAEVVRGEAVCKSCKNHMQIQGAVFDAAIPDEDQRRTGTVP